MWIGSDRICTIFPDPDRLLGPADWDPDPRPDPIFFDIKPVKKCKFYSFQFLAYYIRYIFLQKSLTFLSKSFKMLKKSLAADQVFFIYPNPYSSSNVKSKQHGNF